MPLNGLLGDWALSYPLWEEIKRREPNQKDKLVAKEILYRLPLEQLNHPAVPGGTLRLLTEQDFPQWKALRLGYLEGEGLPQDLSPEQFQESYLRQVRERTFWGLFLEDRLISMAGLNTQYESVGQVGGVYTVPSERKKSYSKQVMKKLMDDCQSLHRLKKLILFTGEGNLAARAVYEGLGFERIGHYGMFFR